MRRQPHLPRMIRIAFFVGLNVILGIYFLSQLRLPIPEPVQQFAARLNMQLPAGTIPASLQLKTVEPNLTQENLLAEVNQLRSQENLPPLTHNSKLATVAAQLLQAYSRSNYEIESVELDGELKTYLKDAGYRYQWVSHHALVGPATTQDVGEAWQQHKQQHSAITNSEFTEVGFASTVIDDERGKLGVVVQLLAQPYSSPTSPKVSSSNPASWRELPDSEVIDALNAYRQTHGVRPLNVNENLCTYAEKRVQDLLVNGGLDNHAGFKSDFADQSNLPVGIRDYPGGSIGENLAHQYCKNMTTGESFVAQTGTALIEWCFDSSTKGHREAQLNQNFNNVCVRHGNRMYVVIFGE